MSYLTQSQLSADSLILQRVTACAATEGVVGAQGWAYQHQWELSAQPGWVDAYAQAREQHEHEPEVFPPPGANEAAITDEMILLAVHRLLGIEPDLPDEPEDDGEEPEIGDEPGVEPEGEGDIPDEPGEEEE